MQPLKTFLRFFGIQFLYYGLLTWNYRSIAAGFVGSVFVSDLACAAISFTLIKHIVKSESKVALAGYVLGGAAGSVASVLATKAIY